MRCELESYVITICDEMFSFSMVANCDLKIKVLQFVPFRLTVQN